MNRGTGGAPRGDLSSSEMSYALVPPHWGQTMFGCYSGCRIELATLSRHSELQMHRTRWCSGRRAVVHSRRMLSEVFRAEIWTFVAIRPRELSNESEIRGLCSNFSNRLNTRALFSTPSRTR
ncbi:hypothetical protein OBBRIDRAFT_253491 [Obba rivulosa]|uniref:Uncharacterized protein n=1 Tax=Obba rivulosa TaxID=1052685 RepID=A0A8E2DQJ2_9APHY|nr:hypothetical protein OBBRIDRAFT_253491 [Obba rivulosa]